MPPMKRKVLLILTCILVVAVLGLGVFFESQSTHITHQNLSTKVTVRGSHLLTSHYFGGFSVTTPQMVTTAAHDGISEAQTYEDPAIPTSPMGQALQSTNVHQIDSTISIYLHEYECHVGKTTKPAGASHCAQDYPSMTASGVLSVVSNYLQQIKSDPLVDAYWVLDDSPMWDVGGSKVLLQQIHSLIQQYTPDRPAICGFGGEVGTMHDDYWHDQLAENFSPQGCDMVGLYIYSAYFSPTHKPPRTTDVFDWSMSTILPKIFTSLSKRGWDKAQEPFIGIGQTFSGIGAGNAYYVNLPSAKNIAAQTLSFCQHGAIGVFFYAYDTRSELINPQTPMNNVQLEQGVQQGVAACNLYWQTH